MTIEEQEKERNNRDEANRYEVLAVKRGASEKEIEAAYRAAIRVAHPDKGGNHDECAKLNKVRKELRGVGCRS